MTREKLKIGVMALAIGMFAVSCGSGGNKQQSGAATITANNKSSDNYNPKEQFTAVPVNIDFVEDWMLPADGVITEVKLEDEGLGIYAVRIEGISKTQCEKYQKTLETKGMVFGFDACNNGKVVIDFTKTFLKDKAEDSVLTLHFYKK